MFRSIGAGVEMDEIDETPPSVGVESIMGIVWELKRWILLFCCRIALTILSINVVPRMITGGKSSTTPNHTWVVVSPRETSIGVVPQNGSACPLTPMKCGLGVGVTNRLYYTAIMSVRMRLGLHAMSTVTLTL